MKHVVMYSGGIGSFCTALRVKELYGSDDLYLVFADVGGQHDSPHVGEDEDTYRFIDETAEYLGGTLVKLNEGRNIWEVFKDDRFLGNARLANCSKFLKQKPSRAWLEENCDPEDTAVYVGIDWTETHRIPAIEQAYLPYTAFAPMCEPPYMSKEDMIFQCKLLGIEPPRAYAEGFPHNNCGGFCVRAGHGQFKKLLEWNRDRYLFHEQKEEEMRQYLEKDVAILRDRRGGKSRPLTLKEFRQRFEGEDETLEVDEFDLGGCGCFVD